jgi:hypothetical protein
MAGLLLSLFGPSHSLFEENPDPDPLPVDALTRYPCPKESKHPKAPFGQDHIFGPDLALPHYRAEARASYMMAGKRAVSRPPLVAERG